MLLTIYTVLNNTDGDPGSLRDAINQSNGDTAQVNTIKFALPAGFRSIALQTNLPAITQRVTIDGLSQSGSNGVPIVELVGSVNATTGLDVETGGVKIQGLVIDHFSTNGILLAGTGGSSVIDCYIGTNVAGSAASANGKGIKITSPNNTIGGATAGNGNLISGNTSGVYVTTAAATGNVIVGNFVGTSLDGKKAIPNTSYGLEFESGQNRVGGTTAAERNIVSGNATGILLDTNANANLIEGNYIGTDLTGAAALGNTTQGIWISSGSNNTIGGTTPTTRNVISGNGYGINFNGTQSNLIQGNFIGTDLSGLNPIPNRFIGISGSSNSSKNTIGGTAAGAGNVIASNAGDGVQAGLNDQIFGNKIGVNANGDSMGNGGNGITVFGSNVVIGSTAAGAGNIISNNAIGIVISPIASIPANSTQVVGNTIATNKGAGVLIQKSTQNSILNNSVDGNLGLGISLDVAAGSPAANTNIKTPFPSAVIDDPNNAGNKLVQGLIIAAASTSGYRVQFFASAQYASDGTTSGKQFLGEVTVNTNASSRGVFSFSYTPDPQLPVITATITDPSGNTSQFSNRPPAPVNLLPGPLTIAQNGSITLSDIDSINPSIAYSSNSGTNQLQVSLGVSHGTLTLSGTANLAVTGNSTGGVSITGTLAAINTALDGLVYTPIPGYNGSDTLSVTSSNLAGVELGGNQTRTDTTSITITPLADSPTVTPATTSANTETTGGLVITPGAVTTNAAFFKISNISGGTLFKSDGTTAIAAGSFIAVADGAAGLKFTPANNFIGQSTFTVQSATSASDAGLVGTAGAGTVTVNPRTSTTTLTGPSGSVNAGQAVTLTAKVSPSSATGTVTFLEGSTVLGTGTLANGTVTINPTTLAVGTHTVTAQYGGDTITATSASANVTVTVAKVATATTLATLASPVNKGASVTFTATVSPATAGGTVSFLDGTTVLGTGTLSNGTATYSSSVLTVGTHSITARYEGDANDATSTSAAQSIAVQLLTSTTTLAGPSAPVTQGQTVTLTATVAPSAASGTVTFKEGSTMLGSGTLSGGSYSLPISTLGAGTHNIIATYSGDASYVASSSDAFTVVINTITKTDTTAVLSPIPATLNVGQSVTFTATVNPATGTGTPTGSVTFKDGSTILSTATLSSGTATYITSALAVGAHSITVQYGGDAGFNGSAASAAQTVTVSKMTTTTTLLALPASIAAGQSLTLQARVSAGSGTVSFLDGTTVLGTATLSGGAGSATVTTLTAGQHSLSARYEGDAANASSVSTAQTVTVGTSPSIVPTTTTLAPLSSAIAGQPVTFTATVSPSGATGTVTFLEGATTLGTGTLVNNQASFTTSSLGIGQHVITAQYGGNASFAASAVSTSQTITINSSTPSDTTATFTRLEIGPNASTYGAGITFTALVNTGGNGLADGGVVRFVDGTNLVGTAPLSDGVAVLTVAGLDAGTHLIQAYFDGTSTLASSVSALATALVEPALSTVTLIAAAGSGASAGQVALVAHVALGIPQFGPVTAPQGTVQFFLGEVLLGNASIGQDGVAVLMISAPIEPSLPTLHAVYVGNGDYLSDSSPAVNLPGPMAPVATSIELSVSVIPSTPKGSYMAKLRAVVTDSNGVPISTGFVTLTLPHGRKVRVAIHDGVASLNLYISNRSHWSATASYTGSPGLLSSKSITVKFSAIAAHHTKATAKHHPSAKQAVHFRAKSR